MVKKEQKPIYVRRMFDAIAPTYDFMNSVMTAGAHHLWRRTVAREIVSEDPSIVLDLACGTGDLSLAIMQEVMSPCTIIGLDFSRPMLRLAQKKHSVLAENRAPIIFLQANGLSLPLPDASVDVVTNAFLLRNLVDLGVFFAECHRVLRPGGRFITLEITHPPYPIFRNVFALYFKNIVPILGKFLVSHQEAYTYLPTSLQSFPNAPALAKAMRASGFTGISYRYVGLGTVAVHSANRVI